MRHQILAICLLILALFLDSPDKYFMTIIGFLTSINGRLISLKEEQ